MPYATGHRAGAASPAADAPMLVSRCRPSPPATLRCTFSPPHTLFPTAQRTPTPRTPTPLRPCPLLPLPHLPHAVHGVVPLAAAPRVPLEGALVAAGGGGTAGANGGRGVGTGVPSSARGWEVGCTVREVRRVPRPCLTTCCRDTCWQLHGSRVKVCRCLGGAAVRQ